MRWLRFALKTCTASSSEAHGEPCEAQLEIRCRRIRLLPGTGNKKHYPAFLTVLHVQERDASGSDRLEWKLITNPPVGSEADAVEKIDWYAMRWKLEKHVRCALGLMLGDP